MVPALSIEEVVNGAAGAYPNTVGGNVDEAAAEFVYGFDWNLISWTGGVSIADVISIFFKSTLASSSIIGCTLDVGVTDS
jgi:hypothetical protein